MSDIIPSPCISLCLLDKNDVCVGCYRTANEIVEWMGCDNDKKREILIKCQNRRQDDQPHALK